MEGKLYGETIAGLKAEIAVKDREIAELKRRIKRQADTIQGLQEAEVRRKVLEEAKSEEKADG